MGGREFVREETRQARLGLEAQDAVEGFEDHASGVGDGRWNGAGDGRESGGGEDAIDEGPEREGFAVGEKIGAAGDGGIREKFFGGEEMRVGGVVEVDRVHEVRAVAEAAELSGASAREDARDEMVVAGSPNQVRAQRDGGEGRAVGGEDALFGEGFGLRIGREKVRGIGQ